MRITESQLRSVIRQVLRESINMNKQEDLPRDPDLIDDPSLADDILNSTRQIPEGIKIKSLRSIKRLKENRD